MAYPTTTCNSDTELGAVNAILAALGQAPVSRIYTQESTTYTVEGSVREQRCDVPVRHNYSDKLTVPELQYINPEVAFAHQLLKEVTKDVQNEGWVWNRENHYPLHADEDGIIAIPGNMLRLDIHDGQTYRTTDVVRRDGKLYDKMNHTYEFKTDTTIYCDILWCIAFEDMPSAFQRYVTLRASGRAATQMVTNPTLVQLLATQEAQARGVCMEYECNQGDYTFFGTPEGTAYRSYQPYRTLAR